MSEIISKNKKVLTLEQSRSILLFLSGVSVTLLWMVFGSEAGQIRYGAWVIPWVVSTSFGIGIGILMLIGEDWRKVPFEDRRGIAIGFLIMAYVNVITLMVYSWRVESWIIHPLFPAMVFGLFLYLVFWRVYRMEDKKEEIFP